MADVIIENRERDIKRIGDFDYDGSIVRVVIGSTDDRAVRDASSTPLKVSEIDKDRASGLPAIFGPEIRIPAALYKTMLTKPPIKAAIEGWKTSGSIKVYPAT